MIIVNDSALLNLIRSAQQGDQIALENLISQNKTFIENASNKICRRHLDWNHDDELSIALIAFNEAIDGYDPEKGAHFFTFAYQVIHQRLVDYFRKEKKHYHIPLSGYSDNDRENNQFEIDKAFEVHHLQEEQAELAEILVEFEQRLLEYKISLQDLVEKSPKHKDTREKLVYAAKHLAKDKELMNVFKQTKRIPVTNLIKIANVSRRVLENGRVYIISLLIIITEDKFAQLRHFAGLHDS